MAKAKRQTHRVLKDKYSNPVNPGDDFIAPTGAECTLEKVGDSYAKVDVRTSNSYTLGELGLRWEEEKQGLSLHLMEEEAALVTALARYFDGMLPGPPRTSLDGTHDISYWLGRLLTALSAEGFDTTNAVVQGAYQDITARSRDVYRGAAR